MLQRNLEGFLFVVSGLPASGKSTVASRLAKALQIPLLSKDGILERLFDTIGLEPDHSNLDKLRAATYRILWDTVRRIVKCKGSLIVEANFDDEAHSAQINYFAEQYGVQIIQIHFAISPQMGFRRFLERQESGKRHSGHPRRDTYEEYCEVFVKGKTAKLQLKGELIEVDALHICGSTYAAVLQKTAATIERIRMG